jgi:hypothetical protein
MNRHQKAVFYFVRYSLMLYVPWLLFTVAGLLFQPALPQYLKVVFIVIGLTSLAAFCILPGIIYEGEYKGPFHGITLDQLKYTAFWAFTAGLGPIYIYFRKYDPLLKKYFKKEEQTRGPL